MRAIYNPLALPDNINFAKASKGFPLTREQKTKLQIALSKLTLPQLKGTIKKFEYMEYECLEGNAKIQWKKIGKYVVDAESQQKVFQELSPKLRDDFKMAAYCKFCKEFAKMYLYSLEKQNKI